jgi:hypothetical protein
MAKLGYNFQGAALVNEPTHFEGPVTIGGSGGSLTIASAASFTQSGSSSVPSALAGSSAPFATAAGQPGFVNGQGLAVLESGVIAGSPLTAAGTVASTASETQLIGAPIPAGDPAAGAVYAVSFAGVYSDTGTPTLAFGLRYGGAAGTAICAIAAQALGSGVSAVPFEGEAILQFWSGAQAVGKLRVGLGTSASTNATTPLVASSAAAGVAVVSTSAKVMSVTVTWGTSSASNTISALTGYAMRLA